MPRDRCRLPETPIREARYRLSAGRLPAGPAGIPVPAAHCCTWAGTGSSYFLEAPCHQDNSDAWFMQGNHRYYGNIYVGGSSAARPVIDVPKTKIQY